MGCGASTAAPAKYAVGKEPTTDIPPKDAPAVLLVYNPIEAAAEGDELKKQLSQKLPGKKVALDSEFSASDVIAMVKNAEALVLLQTKGVLTKPEVLLELLTAVDAGVAIIAIKISGPQSYCFDTSLTLLTNLDALLEEISPGAPALLQSHGHSLPDASHKLANVVPKVISRPLDTAASAKVFAASLSDLAGTVLQASKGARPPLPPRDVWLAQREPPPAAASIAEKLAPNLGDGGGSIRKLNLSEVRVIPTTIKSARQSTRQSSTLSMTARSSTGRYAAFLSHAKAEAAMEARFMQTQMEELVKARIFLDSDDLTDLRQLLDHVRGSDCLVLLLTRRVLTRSWCLLELLAALDAGIPIVGVSLIGPAPYAEEASLSLLTHLDGLLEEVSPGASDLLRQHDIDLTDAAHKLASFLPTLHSNLIRLDTGASRSVLSATLEDVVDSIRSTLPMPPPVTSKEAFLASRGPVPKAVVGQFVARAAGAMDLTVGCALLQRSKGVKPLAPLAFLLQSISQGSDDAKHLKDDAKLFTACAAVVEQLLLGAVGVESETETCDAIADALEEAAEHLVHLSEERFGVAEAVRKKAAGEYTIRCLKGITEQLHTACATLQLSKPIANDILAQAAYEQSEHFDRLVERRLKKQATAKGMPTPAEAPEPEPEPAEAPELTHQATAEQLSLMSAMQSQLATMQTAVPATPAMKQMLELQSKMLQEQAGSMQAMMTSQVRLQPRLRDCNLTLRDFNLTLRDFNLAPLFGR